MRRYRRPDVTLIFLDGRNGSHRRDPSLHLKVAWGKTDVERVRSQGRRRLKRRATRCSSTSCSAESSERSRSTRLNGSMTRCGTWRTGIASSAIRSWASFAYWGSGSYSRPDETQVRSRQPFEAFFRPSHEGRFISRGAGECYRRPGRARRRASPKRTPPPTPTSSAQTPPARAGSSAPKPTARAPRHRSHGLYSAVRPP